MAAFLILTGPVQASPTLWSCANKCTGSRSVHNAAVLLPFAGGTCGGPRVRRLEEPLQHSVTSNSDTPGDPSVCTKRLHVAAAQGTCRNRPASLAGPALHYAVRTFIAESMEHTALAGHEREVAARMLPTLGALKRAGRSDLIRGIRAAGGSRVVAADMGLVLSANAVADFKNEFGALQDAIRQFILREERQDLFPTADKLRARGRLDIIAGVKAHGGSAHVASAMDLKLQRGRRPASLEDRVDWLRQQFSSSGFIPTNQELIADGRIDVLRHLVACGGRVAVAETLALPVPDGTVFSEDMFSHDVCTSSIALEYNSPQALSREEIRGGGGGAVLDADGGRRRRHHLYRDFGMVKDELLCFIYDWGHIGVMPTAQQLIRAKRRDLVRAMALHGGQKVVADRLGLVRQSLSRKQVLERVNAGRRRPRFTRNSSSNMLIGQRTPWPSHR